ncbi:ImmA/IrrE family metallo-endopeptidase [Paraclostridium bifermentans]
MSTVYLYVRKPCSTGTLVIHIDKKEAIEIMEEFRNSEYQVGMFYAKNITALKKIYGEFSPYKEVTSKKYILDILSYSKKDESLVSVKNSKSIDLYSLAKLKLNIHSENIKKNTDLDITDKELEVLESVPYSDLQKKGYVSAIRRRCFEAKREKVLEVRKLCNVNRIDALTNTVAACRKQHNVSGSLEALSVWLKIGENKAKSIKVGRLNKEKLKSLIPKFREMTFRQQSEFHDELVKLCADCGIKLILVEKLTNTNVMGATQWVDDIPIIQLTLKGKRADSFWFTFLHEVAHILIHDNKDFHMQEECKKYLEDEADRNARDWLIPQEDYNRFIWNNINKSINLDMIEKFAETISIHPSIVIGRLQHEKIIGWNMYNECIPKVKIM